MTPSPEAAVDVDQVPPPSAPATATLPHAVGFATDLASHGDRVAVLTPQGGISYRDLAQRVAAVARELGTEPRLVLLAGANDLRCLVVYLAALAAGHPVLLAPGDRPEHLAALVAAYDPDVVAGGDRAWRLDQRREGSAHRLHPDLALLLTTSGTTGSAKLVRLSRANLAANADAIATYLAIRPDDRAATTLPMHYCYGLSVINSHLLRGAALVLTDRSVTDPGFWDLFREHRATSLAGVPYTFDLLDRVGFETMALPHLRYVTQAGGRLAPERVRRYAELGRRRGWDFFVMYGQTEATARMAYLPPDLAPAHPECIGVPIPGGAFRLEPVPDWPEPDTGELVFQGPNVMLGYAERPADLGLGRVVGELRTGDVARRTPEGLYRIVGRRSRFVKLYGLRVDLDRVEAALARHGRTAWCVGSDEALVIAVEPAAGQVPDPEQVRRVAAAECGVPARVVRVCELPALPRLPNGKPDYPAVRALTRVVAPADDSGPAAPATTAGVTTHSAAAAVPVRSAADLCRLYAEILGRSDVTVDSTFVGLGGDSLSYVELSVRLERALGQLPEQWHTTAIRDLRPAPVRRWRGASLDTSVALRGIATFLIVGTHASLFAIAGGAHLLLGVAGFNFARFHLAATEHRTRLRHFGRGIARVAGVSMSWIAVVFLLSGSYSLANVFLLHYVFGSEETRHGWHFWFIESLVYIQLAVLCLLALPVVDRLERRFPFGLPMSLAAVGLITRYELVPGAELATPLRVFWLFALGWAAAKAATTGQRLLVTAAILATIPGFFESPRRVAIMIAGMVLLVWVARIPSLRPVNRVLGLLAGGSLFIYLTHWQVYPHLSGVSPALAVVVSLAVGIGYGVVVTRMTAGIWPPVRRWSTRWWADRRSRDGGRSRDGSRLRDSRRLRDSSRLG